MKLHENMRIKDNKDAALFNNFLLDIGNGTIPIINHPFKI